MARKVSIAGKGAQILGGGVSSLIDESHPAEERTSEGFAGLGTSPKDEAALKDMLAEEAEMMGDTKEPEAPKESPAPEPEATKTTAEEAHEEKPESPPPVQPEPAHLKEAEETPETEAETAEAEPPASTSVVPPKLHVGGPEAVAALAGPPGPGPDELGTAAVETKVQTEEAKKRVLASLTEEQKKALGARIDDLYRQVTKVLSGKQDIAELGMGELREARKILLEEPEKYVDAEYKVYWVDGLIKRAENSRKTSSMYGVRLFLYELAFLIVYGGLFLILMLAPGYLQWIVNSFFGTTASGSAVVQYSDLWATFLWGGIGGVVGAWYHLWWHVSQLQDFDPQYTMWYLVQPLMGFILGALVYLTLEAGLLAMSVPTSASGPVHALPLLLAGMAGFRQNFVYGLIDRLIQTFTPEVEGESAVASGKSAK